MTARRSSRSGTQRPAPSWRLLAPSRGIVSCAGEKARLGNGGSRESGYVRLCSLIPGFGVKLSAIILAGPTVLSAVGACPPHDGVRRRWWINVASAVSLIESSQKIGRSHHRHRPGRDIFSRRTAGILWSRYCSLRGNLLLRPVELGSVDPHAVQNDRQASRHSDDCALHPTMPGNLHAPGLEPRPLAAVGHQDQGRLESVFLLIFELGRPLDYRTDICASQI